MIHTLITLTRPLFVLDEETTGLDVQTARIVELGFQQWDATGMVKEWCSLINPGIPIPEATTKIHGISDASMALCQVCKEERLACRCENFHVVPSFRQLATSLSRGFVNCDYAGKNVRYDLRILDTEFRRAGVSWNYIGARIIDIDRLEALAVPRSLSHLHKKYVGREHDGAHGALSDVRAASTVIVKQLQEHAMLPRDLDQLHAAQWPGIIDSEGKFRMVNGVATCTFGKWRDKAMKDIEPSYWDWLLNADFSTEVKALAAEAKMGRFPK